jgi:glycosyltransferase involved in cell wall biosynthesis
MRLLIDLQGYQGSSRKRGIGRYSQALSSTMMALAQDIDFRLLLNAGLHDSLAAIHTEFGQWGRQDIFGHFRVHGPIAEVYPQNHFRARAAELVREAAVASHRPDHVMSTSLFEGLSDDIAVSAPRYRAGYTTSAILYDLIPYSYPQVYLSDAGHQNWYYRRLASLQRTDLLLAISEHSRTEAIARLGIPADKVINIGAAVSDFFQRVTLTQPEQAALRQRLGLQQPFIMYTGGLDARKNIEGLIRAYSKLPHVLQREHQLAVVCSIRPQEREKLTAYVRECGIRDQGVVFTGYVTDEDLRALYSLCELFVFPPLYEGFGLPALEAMACGAPTIASNTTSIPEVVGREDALFDPYNDDAITALMSQVLDSPDLRDDLRKHAARQAELFSWEISAQKALDGIKRCVREAPAWLPAPHAQTRRPSLALVSPLPPLKSGISDYCAELIPCLSVHYEITVVSREPDLSDPWVRANVPVISPEKFAESYTQFDRVLYQFGNSEFHAHMFGLLERCPGVVVLHDFFLSGVTAWMEHKSTHPTRLSQALYTSHGYDALLQYQEGGRDHCISKYPCNLPVINRATGIIVHSDHSLELAQQWYGDLDFRYWRKVPLLRNTHTHATRTEARRKLGLSDDELLVTTFGIMGNAKCPEQIMDAWLQSSFAQQARARFVFVGEDSSQRYTTMLRAKLAAAGASNMTITGFATREDYKTYLAAADIGIQLRTSSRGETSAAVLDCLVHGLPLIMNRHGSNAEYPDNIAISLPDLFTQEELIVAMEQLAASPELRSTLSRTAREFITTKHDPAHAALQIRDAIEAFVLEPRHLEARLVNDLSTLTKLQADPMADLPEIASCLASNRAEPRPARLLIDLTRFLGKNGQSSHACMPSSLNTWLQALLRSSTSASRVELIYWSPAGWRHARTEAARLLALTEAHTLPDSLVAIYAEDVVLSLAGLPGQEPYQAHIDALAILQLRVARLLTLAAEQSNGSTKANLPLEAIKSPNARDLLNGLVAGSLAQ